MKAEAPCMMSWISAMYVSYLEKWGGQAKSKFKKKRVF